MTEKEAIKELKDENEKCCEQCEGHCSEVKNGICTCRDATILSALEQYRSTCTDYEEELAAAKETIRKLLCNEYGSVCQFCIHDGNKEAMCRGIGGSGAWCCENAKWNGKSD